MLYRNVLPLAWLACSVFASGRLPFVFEKNEGQAPPEVQMLGRQGSATLMLAGDEVWLRAPAAQLRMRFEGRSGKLRADGLDASGGVSNYYIGKTAVKAPHYERARYRQVYPGIDAIFYEKDGRIEYDFVVTPGSDPARIRLSFPEAGGLKVDSSGDLLIGAMFRQARPVAYQHIGGKRVDVEARFHVADGKVRFYLGRYDRQVELIIDPTLVYSTLIGGNAFDSVTGMGVDSAGNIYIAGRTESNNLPVTPGALPTPPATGKGFVAKLNPSGSSILFLTYLGGNATTSLHAMAMDGAGNTYLTGSTQATNFPVTDGAAQMNYRSVGADSTNREDSFVTKLSANGSVVYSTYLAGELADAAYAIAIDGTGNAYIGGITRSRNFVITPGAMQTTYGGGFFDCFVAKLNASGSAFLYGTYWGGNSDEAMRSIAVDSLGVATVLADGGSKNMPTTPGALQSTPGAFYEGYLARLSPQGNSLLYSTYIGGSGTDTMRAVTHDSTGATYITGETDSANFTTTPGAFQRTIRLAGDFDGFVMKLSPTNSLVYSTLIGGSQYDGTDAIAIDRNGNVIVVGATSSPDFPAALPRQFYGGRTDGVLFRLNASGSAVLDSTYMGRTGAEGFSVVKIDSADAIHVAGTTSSTDFYLSASPLQTTRQGSNDGFIQKYTFPSAPPPVALQAMVNAASFVGGPVAPGEIVTLFGSPIGPANLTTLQLDGENVATVLEGTRVFFDGVEAPLIYASSGQTSVVVPYSVAGKSAVEVVVEYQGQRSQTVQAIIVPSSPAMFTVNSSGSGPAAILNQDGAVNSKASPAGAQSVVVLYGTGGGLVTPQAVTGGIAAGIANQNLPVTVEFGTGSNRRNGEVLYAGSAPGLVNGVLQVNVKLPAGYSGTVPLRVRVGTAVSPDVTVEVSAN